MFILCLLQPLKTGQTKAIILLLLLFVKLIFMFLFSLFTLLSFDYSFTLFSFLKNVSFLFSQFCLFFWFFTRGQGNTFPPLSTYLWSGNDHLLLPFLSKYISLDLLMTIANVGRMRCGECFIFLAASVIRGSSFQLFVHLQKHSDEPTTT